jgi:Lrp/AsnC family transcriptional regulator, leucine-responsive regulatory protein
LDAQKKDLVVSVDEMNKRILRLLRTNGKMSYREVASALRRSPSTVRDRITRMEEGNIILGYITLVDPKRVEMNAEALLFASMKEGAMVGDMTKLRRVEGVLEVLYVSGERNIMIRIQAPDNRALEEKVSREIMPLGLQNVDLRVIIESVMRFPETSLI